MRFYPVLTFIICLVSCNVYGQISLTSEDFLGLIGSTINIEQDTSQSISVDVGQAGANQEWDFSTQVLDAPFVSTQEFVAVDQTPFSANFLNANLALKLSFPGFTEGASYLYFEITPTQARQLGSGVIFSSMGMDFANVTNNIDIIAPLPASFGTSWTQVTTDTSEEFSIFKTISYDSTVNVVDGWGTIKLPGAQFQCLRIFQKSWNRSQTFVSNVLTDSSSSNNLSYLWAGKGNYILAQISSQDGETDPNFTTATSFMRRSSGITPTLDLQSPSIDLVITGSNPFSESTAFRYRLAEKDAIDLAIFDFSGHKIKTLFSGVQLSGTHEVTWDGQGQIAGDTPNGTYIAVLNSARGTVTKKVQLVR